MPSSFLCRRRLFPLTLLVAGTVSAPLGESAELRCAVVEVSSPQLGETNERARRSKGYSATEILDLEIRVYLPASLAGEHRLDVKVYTPDRQLYQVLTVPFESAEPGTQTAADGARRERRKLADVPRPLPLIAATELPSGQRGRARFTRVSATLPVAGTSIVSSSLYGTWTAMAFLDGSTASCGPNARFAITE